MFLKNGRVLLEDAIQHMREHFPAHLFRILPKGNIFEIMEKLRTNNSVKNSVYIRGKYIKLMQEHGDDFTYLIPHLKVEEERPKLEDMYLYYERLEEKG